MILLDTNVLIYAFDPSAKFHHWARGLMIDAITGEGAAVNPVIVAELCVGDSDPQTVPERLQEMGIHLLNLPSLVATSCAQAFANYLHNRRLAGEAEIPKVPLPDFFIGAHALVLGMPLATADPSRYCTYFPDLRLILKECDE